MAETISCSILTLPSGPGYGKEGRRYNLKTNLFPLKIKNPDLIFHYDVEMVRVPNACSQSACSCRHCQSSDAPGPDLDRDSKQYKKMRLQTNLLVFQEILSSNSNPGNFFYDEEAGKIKPAFDSVKNSIHPVD